ncbi:MAG: phosphotransferase [Myxococcota bacterium]
MADTSTTLPAAVTQWVEAIGGGRITTLRRHVARREAWIVDVERGVGDTLEGFLRIQRDAGGPDPRRLERETRIVEALGRAGIPVPAVHGWNPELRVALFARDPGRADLDAVEDATVQRAVLEDFMDAIAELHALDPAALGLDDVLGPLPTTPEQTALGAVDEIAGQWDRFLSRYDDPLTIYGLAWLRRFVPQEVARVSLVQGDTGPVNFMFQGSRVSAIIDWETGHWGDPMEDLGNICVREFYNPCGGLEGLFERWAAHTGFPYTRFAAQYYAVHQNVRGMIPIHVVCHHAHATESLAAYLCYRYVGDRATAEMLAAAMQIPIERPELPDEDSGDDDLLAQAALHNLSHDITPALSDPFARSRARDTATLVACIDRRRRYGDRVASLECDDLGALLGRRPADRESGTRALCEALREGRLPDDAVIPYLARRAYRDEWLHAPSTVLYPDRVWSPID